MKTNEYKFFISDCKIAIEKIKSIDISYSIEDISLRNFKSYNNAKKQTSNLRQKNIKCTCFLVPPSTGRLKDLIAQNKKRAMDADVNVIGIGEDASDAEIYAKKSYLVVDALLGLGAGAGYAPRPIFQAVCDAVNTGSKIVSIDGPSGIEMDDGKKYLERPVKAAETYVLGFMKRGLIEPCAAEYVGQLSVLDIFA